jgi:hypothetical protein
MKKKSLICLPLLVFLMSGCRVVSPTRIAASEQAVVWDAAVTIYNEDYSAFRALLDPEIEKYGRENFREIYNELRKEIKHSELKSWSIKLIGESAEPYLLDHFDGLKFDTSSGVSSIKIYGVSITPKNSPARQIASVTVIYSPVDDCFRIRRVRLLD